MSVESHLKGQLAFLRRSGLTVHVIARDTGRLDRILHEDGVSGHSRPLRRDPSPFADIAGLAMLLIDIARLRPRMVVYGTPKGALLASMAARVIGVPHRVYLVFGIRAETASGVTRRILLSGEALAMRLSTVQVAVGAGLMKRMRDLGLPTGNIVVVGAGSANGVDVQHFRAARAERTSIETQPIHSDAVRPTVVGFVGRITADKGIDVLVGALVELRTSFPQFRLRLVGPPESLESLSDATRAALAQPWVTMTGDLPDTASAYPEMDIFCLPSRREGLPTVILEAAAAGVPIVATNATGVADVVIDGVTGTIVEIDAVHDLAAAILAVASDPYSAKVKAVAAQQFVAERFDQTVVWEQMRMFYSRMLSGSDEEAPHGSER
ncbi:glycosyltransferase [Leifsonia stereocauli]|uniref:glycosyltransferase n=1 Tax=Leifsonia stereocauli TaxID=3134136 RepID=UPI003CC7A4F9